MNNDIFIPGTDKPWKVSLCSKTKVLEDSIYVTKYKTGSDPAT